MNLTSENTAIVLDSTSDYPDAPARFPNMRFVPLYVRFGDETYRDYVELGPAEFYEKLRTSPVHAGDGAADAAGLRHGVRGARGVRADLLAARLVEGLGHVPERRARRAGDRRRQGARRRHADRVARDRDARARDPAAARARDDGRGDRRRSSSASTRDCDVALHGRDARVPPARRSDRQGAGARRLAPERAADPRRRGRRGRSPSRACAGGRRRSPSSSGASSRRRRTSPGFASRSRTPTPSRVGRHAERARRGACARRRRSSSRRRSAPSSARTPGPAPSGSSGSRTRTEPWLGAGARPAIEIVFETHSTTTDNERWVASGWLDGQLSPLGRRQAKELGERRAERRGIVAVFCSDLGRAVETAQIAFGGRGLPIFHDWRLRECNYGMLNGTRRRAARGRADEARPRPVLRAARATPRSSRACGASSRISRRGIADKRIVVIGHSATKWALDHLLEGTPLDELVEGSFRWQPGWLYTLVDRR